MPDDIILQVDALPQINLEADGLASTTIGVDTIAKGEDGDSAYQVAVNNGFVGTEAEWLASLVGPQGPQGTTDWDDITNKPNMLWEQGVDENDQPVAGAIKAKDFVTSSDVTRTNSAPYAGAFVAGGDNTATGNYVAIAGMGNTAYSYSVVAGRDNQVTKAGAVAFGRNNIINGNGSYAFTAGYGNTVAGNCAVAICDENSASGVASFAVGYRSNATAQCAVAIGQGNTASGVASFAEAYHTQATEQGAHAEGHSTIASSLASHAEGHTTTASGNVSHAEGWETVASGFMTHAEGHGTQATARYNHVFGEYNISDTGFTSANARGTYIEIVGNGDDAQNRSNARTLDWSGNEVLGGKLTVGSDPTSNMDVATKQYVDNVIPSVPTNLSSFTDDLGSSPTHTHSQYAESSNLATVATSGDYGDLSNTPTLVTRVTATGGDGVVNITNQYSDGSFVASSAEISGYVEGATYSNRALKLQRKNIVPDITVFTADSSPTSGSGQLVTSGGVYTALASKADSSDIPTNTSDLTNDSGFIDSSALLWEQGVDANDNPVAGSIKAKDFTSSGTTYTNTASGISSLAFGANNTVSSNYNVAFGYGNTVAGGGGSSVFGTEHQVTAGTYGFATGVRSIISGNNAVAMGWQNTASNYNAFAVGNGNTASGNSAIAIGYQNTASGSGAIAEGYKTTSSALGSHAEGHRTTASGNGSHSDGRYTKAVAQSNHVFGEYNVEDSGFVSADARGTYIEIVGNGADGQNRSNARTLDWSGNEVLAGKLTVGANPTANMDVATKQYVDNAVLNVAVNANECLTFWHASDVI